MHDIVVEEFEGYLAGNASVAFHDHLDACPACRAEVASLMEVSAVLRELHAPAEIAPEPSAWFYQGVTRRIIDTQKKEAWGLFSPGAAFFRRIAFASLLVLAGLGSFLVTRESSRGGTDAVAVIAQHDVSAAHTESSDRDRLLVTLANYRQ